MWGTGEEQARPGAALPPALGSANWPPVNHSGTAGFGKRVGPILKQGGSAQAYGGLRVSNQLGWSPTFANMKDSEAHRRECPTSLRREGGGRFWGRPKEPCAAQEEGSEVKPCFLEPVSPRQSSGLGGICLGRGGEGQAGLVLRPLRESTSCNRLCRGRLGSVGSFHSLGPFGGAGRELEPQGQHRAVR